MSLPLKGLKVLDFSTLLPGPYATQLLGDMGAEVLRIESPSRPDLLKLMPPYVGKVSAAHATINRNKKSIALDLKKEESIEIVKQLLQEYDVLVEQFRPGVMARLGLSYDVLKEVQPRLIYCSITGYGQTGPLKDKAGHDINYLALSGLASYSGTKESGPTLASTQIADIAGGSHHAVMSILAAVIQRYETKVGSFLDISMADAAFALNTMFGAGAIASATDPSCGSEMLNGGLFYDYYETSDGRHLSIGSLEPVFYQRLFKVLDMPEWINKASNHSEEIQNELKEAIASKIKQKTQDEWMEVFSKVDACVEPVLTINEAARSQLFNQRNMLVEVTAGESETLLQINTALPFKCDQSYFIGKELGADSKSILKNLGYSDSDIVTLLKNKVIYTP